MNLFRIALANLRIPTSPEESVSLAERAIAEAAAARAQIEIEDDWVVVAAAGLPLSELWCGCG